MNPVTRDAQHMAALPGGILGKCSLEMVGYHTGEGPLLDSWSIMEPLDLFGLKMFCFNIYHRKSSRRKIRFENFLRDFN